MRSFAHILLTLWAGGLWTICGVVAPTLFAMLDRAAAGAVVGRFFSVAAWSGFLIGIALIALTRTRAWAPHRVRAPLIAVSAAAPVLSEIVLGPLMHQARVAGEMQRFALLHGLAGVLFLVACLGTLALVWMINRAE